MKLSLYLGFNNYYNRKVKKYDTLAEYQDNLLLTQEQVNFKPNDGINTEHVINTVNIVDNEAFLIDSVPDYAVVHEDNGTIVSRWFITQWTRLRAGQFRATLRRDVVADNFDKIIEAPCFIEKATITDKSDPAIYNNEDMTFNQIKKSETLLKDMSKISWLVGYVPSDFTVDGGNIEFKFHGTTYTVFAPSNAMIANNMPFKVFAIPFEDINCYQEQTIEGETTIYQTTLSKDLAVVFATTLSASIGSGKVFDVQVLPYCPLRLTDGTCAFTPDATGEYTGKYKIPYTSYIPDTLFDFDYIHKKTDPNTFTNCKQLIFWNVSNKFSFDIENLDIPLPDNALDIKIKNECDMWRLSSPNYSGQFDFNAMKNRGVAKFNVDCMYQPFNPYIHINPVFKDTGLYGGEYDDARGLICAGDYSLPQETNAWTNYQQNNKNFQASFDRQIQNMEVMNKYQRISQYMSAGVGTLQGAATGAFIGSGIAPGVGTVAGAIAGGVASGGAGIADTIMLAAQQKETLDYTKDQFGYQLGNIKALPNNITKTNPFTNNNKIFPVLEYYTCTDTEKQALRDKMKYNGMTIMRVGKIKDWLLEDYSYIKAKLIEIDSDIWEDYHTVVEIASELDKGIRAKKEE